MRTLSIKGKDQLDSKELFCTKPKKTHRRQSRKLGADAKFAGARSAIDRGKKKGGKKDLGGVINLGCWPARSLKGRRKTEKKKNSSTKRNRSRKNLAQTSGEAEGKGGERRKGPKVKIYESTKTSPLIRRAK